MSPPHRTVLIGFGRIAAGYAAAAETARHFRYATHAQVLVDHPAFDWTAVVDPDPASREAARGWPVGELAASARDLADPGAFTMAVLAGPPVARSEAIEALPGLRAVIVEKPLGRDLAEAEQFLAICAARGILVQVNIWRRGDETMRRLAAGELRQRIGTPQVASGIYGNGLLNNGLHLVDLVTMLLGPVREVQALGRGVMRSANPLPGDPDQAFALHLDSGVPVTLLPVDFDHYREVALDVWGTEGRLEILAEGLQMRLTARAPHRALPEGHELSPESAMLLPVTAGEAMWHVYDNLAAALEEREPLWSPGEGTLAAQAAIAAVHASTESGGAAMAIDAIWRT